MYQHLFKVLQNIIGKHKLFKYGFNFSPMYRRSVGRINEVSKDLHTVKLEIPLNYKNRNYVGTIFGGSLFAATDPIYMIQLIQILGDDYVVWDKAATIKYKRPAKEKAYVVFQFSNEEIQDIKSKVNLNNEIDIVKQVNITNKDGVVYAELDKIIYVAYKRYYKKKLRDKKKSPDTKD